MNVQVKTSAGITLVPVETRLIVNRKVFIEGEINYESACEFMKKVMALTADDSTAFIDVFINSPGGEISAGMLNI